MKNIDKENQEISKESNPTNPEDLPEYIWLFTYFFNKKRFKKLSEQREWDYKINLLEDTSKKLNAKAYAITIKEDEVLNQWLEKQLKIELIVESSSRYVIPYFCILKKNRSLWLV